MSEVQNKVNNLAAAAGSPPPPPPPGPPPQAIQVMENVKISSETTQGFAGMQRVALAFAKSSLVPKVYQNDAANCFIAVNIAYRLGADPLMVMQNLYIVHGKPSWSSQFYISAVNSCGRFSALRYEFRGTEGKDDWGCRAFATDKATGDRLEGDWITISLAKAEQWFGKEGSKWKTMPGQMLRYRAATFWTRVYAPELTMGLQTKEEIEDMKGVDPREGMLAPPVAALSPVQEAEFSPVESEGPGEVTEADVDGLEGEDVALMVACSTGADEAALKALLPAINKRPKALQKRFGAVWTERMKFLRAQPKEAAAEPPPEQARQPGEEG